MAEPKRKGSPLCAVHSAPVVESQPSWNPRLGCHTQLQDVSRRASASNQPH